MNHEEQRIWLIKELQKTPSPLRLYPIPGNEQEQKDLLRALMNIWEPKELSEEFLKNQDEYLTEECKLKGIHDIKDLKPIAKDSRIYLFHGDMTSLKVDAITNPANATLEGCFQILHNCADNVIHSASGLQLRLACHKIMEEQGHPELAGQAKITPAFNLPCDYVIHTVGPMVQVMLNDEHEKILASCYRSCLELAKEKGLKSIAFCCISTGVFMFPNERAAEIATETVENWLKETGSDMKVVFSTIKDLDYEIYDKILNGSNS